MQVVALVVSREVMRHQAVNVILKKSIWLQLRLVKCTGSALKGCDDEYSGMAAKATEYKAVRLRVSFVGANFGQATVLNG